MYFVLFFLFLLVLFFRFCFFFFFVQFSLKCFVAFGFCCELCPCIWSAGMLLVGTSRMGLQSCCYSVPYSSMKIAQSELLAHFCADCVAAAACCDMANFTPRNESL